MKCQHGNVKGPTSRLTTLIKHQVILVAELLWSTRHENVLIAKEVLQTWHLETKTCRWVQLLFLHILYYISQLSTLTRSWLCLILTQMATAKSNASFLLLGLNELFKTSSTIFLKKEALTQISQLVCRFLNDNSRHQVSLPLDFSYCGRHSHYSHTNTLVCTAHAHELSHALSPRRWSNTRGLCMCVPVFVCMHAHWCLWISVRTPDMSPSCRAVSFLQLISLSATVMRPCWLTNLLIRCSVCNGHSEKHGGSVPWRLWMIMSN